MPCSCALRAAFSAAICAAKGVDLLEPLKPTWPAEAQLITFPLGSVIDTIVLLNVLLMCAAPWATFFFSLRRTFLAPAAVRALGGMSLRFPTGSWPGQHARARRSRPHGSLRRAAERLLLAGLLLAGDGLARALARARVRLGALPVDRKSTAVAQPLVAADLHLAADVGGHLAAQVTLDAEVLVDVVAQPQQVLVAEVLDPQVGAHAGRLDGLLGVGLADPVDVGERDLHPLLAGQVDAGQSSHVLGTPSPDSDSALALLVPGVVADDHDPAVPADHLALVADLLHRRLDLHRCRPSFLRSCAVRRPRRGGGPAGSFSRRRFDRRAGRRGGGPPPPGPPGGWGGRGGGSLRLC